MASLLVFLDAERAKTLIIVATVDDLELACSGVTEIIILMRFLVPLTRGIARIELNDLETPANPELRHAELIERLGTVFARVVARPGESLAP